MGMHIDRALKLKGLLASELLSVYSNAIHFKWTHQRLLEEKEDRLFHFPYYKIVPRWVHSYLDGMEEVLRDNIYHYHLVWLMSVDGKLMTRKEINELCAQEKNERDPRNENPFIAQEKDYKSPWARVDNDQSRHCWKDTDGTPLRDKPF